MIFDRCFLDRMNRMNKMAEDRSRMCFSILSILFILSKKMAFKF